MVSRSRLMQQLERMVADSQTGRQAAEPPPSREPQPVSGEPQPARKVRIHEQMEVNHTLENKRLYFFGEDSEGHKAYSQVLNYMAGEMTTNAGGPEIEKIRENFYSPNIINAVLSFISLVKTGGAWDHKPVLKGMALCTRQIGGDKLLPVTPVTGDDRYLYYYDIWSNIHFGFVAYALMPSFLGVHIGNTAYEIYSIELKTLKRRVDLLKNFLLGETTAKNVLPQSFQIAKSAFDSYLGGIEDAISVNTGIELAKKHGTHITPQQLHQAIFNNRTRWDEGKVRYRYNSLKLCSNYE